MLVRPRYAARGDVFKSSYKLQGGIEVGRLIRRSQERAGEPALTWATFGGLAAGIAVMYLTALLVAA